MGALWRWGRCVRRALGVTLWELLELGRQPFPHLSDAELLRAQLRRRCLNPGRPRTAMPRAEMW